MDASQAADVRLGFQIEVPAATFLFAFGGLLAVAAALPAGGPRLLCFALLSGLPPLLVVRYRWRLSELLVVTPISSLLMWALGAPVIWRMGPTSIGAAMPAVVALGLGEWARRTKLQFELEVDIVDLVPVAAMLAALIPILEVFTHNGPSGAGYVARGWFARDSFYFFALAQESIERGGWPAENPFLAGVGNYYPSLLHVGFAALSAQGGQLAATAVRWVAPAYLVATQGLLVLVCLDRRAMQHSGTQFAFSAGVSLIAASTLFLLRPDLAICVQTQVFAIGWLLLLMWLVDDDATSSLAELLPTGVVGTALVLAHTLTGAAAIIVIGSRAVELLAEHSTRRRGVGMLTVAAVLLFVLRGVSALPFEGQRQAFSLEALAGLGTFVTSWAGPMAGVGLLLIGAWRRPLRMLAPASLVGLGAAYYLYGSTLVLPSDRWFVWFNAERFLYLALLVALPLAARGHRALGAAAVVFIAVCAWVAPTALAKDTDTLVSAVPLSLEEADLQVFEQVRHETPNDSRFVTNLRNYALPAFTGRSQNPIESNIWGLNTLDPAEFRLRLTDSTGFFSPRSATERIELLERWGYTHVLIRGDSPPEQVRSWLEREFPPGSVRIMRNDGRYLLLARRGW